ncbi:PfkB family carbohydrate kinase [Kocuria aegyptia]|uniref:Ribokinase n=1 Tax=Kocuria aegyptia TaxID=330943 RepID=A0ABP4WBQ9_9MICC
MADPAARPVYLDCDTGIDDAIALAYLVATPSVELRGIGTVSGNTDAVTAARNTVDLLALLGRPDIPVAVGAQHPLGSRFGGGSPEVHGGSGTGGVQLPRAAAEPVAEPAEAMLIRLAHEHPGELHVVAIGPLTNLARALRQDPALPEVVGSVTVMGGAALVPGNRTPAAEANILSDPEAAAEVLAAPWEVTLVPLDVTMANLLDEGQREQIAAVEHPVMPVLAAMLEHYTGFYTGILGRPSSALHDPLAAAVAAGTVDLGLAPVVRVQVDTTDGPGRGQTICDLRGRYAGYPTATGARCRVVLELAEDFAPHLLRTLRRLDRSAPVEPVRPALTVVGSINIDLTAACERLPAPGETVGGATLHRQPGGKGANQAVAAARLAGRSRMVGAVGDDPDGDAVLRSMAVAGVDTTGIGRVPAPTGTALIAVDRHGENQIVVCAGANAEVSVDHVTFAPEDVVLCQLEIELDAVRETARRTPGYFALNAAPALPLPADLVDRCDLIIVNETEYARIPELADARLVAVTYGAEGSALYEHGRKVASAPGHPVDVVSTVGAGDAFCAALVLALTSGHDHGTALRAANAVGAHAVGDPSSQPALLPLAHYLPAPGDAGRTPPTGGARSAGRS